MHLPLIEAERRDPVSPDAERIHVRGVGRRFGDRVALAGVDLSLRRGERVAFAGPSGSGKSTLLRVIAGALRPTAGEVSVDGESIAGLSARALRRYRATLGIVEQGSMLVPQLSVQRNVIAGCLPQWRWYRALAAMVWPVGRHDVAKLLDRVGLADRQWDQASQLSGGEQQRVAIARALAGDASTLLADEPTAALDPENAREVVELLLDVARERRATLLLSTHWVSLVRPAVDRLIGLREGRVVLDAPAADVTDKDLDELYTGSRERR